MFMFDRFEALRKEKGVTKTFIAEQLGRGASLCQSWKEKKAEPNEEQLRRVADILGTTPEYLTGESDEKAPSMAGERIPTDEDIQAAFWGGYKDLTQDEISAMWDEVRAYAQFKAEEARRKKKK